MKNTFFTCKGGEYVNHFTQKEIFLFKPTCDSLFWYTFVTWNCCVAKKDSITRPSPTSSVARSDIRIKKHAQGSSWRKKVGANAWLLRATTCRWARKNILKKAFSGRFGFDLLESRKFKTICQEQSNGKCPLLGVCKYTPRWWRYSHNCTLSSASIIVYIYISWGWSALLVSTDRAMREPK